MNRATLLIAIVSAGCLPQVGPPVGSGGGGGSSGSGGSGGGAATVSCSNGLRDGDETDVDCGAACAPCALGKLCASAPDCASGVCSATQCAAQLDPCRAAFAGCSAFFDATDAGTATIRFPQGGSRYSPDCVRVRFGQSVVFEGGDFASHPLRQACGPVPNVFSANGGTTDTVVMNRALGVFGFYCAMHGSASGSGMAGAIEVVR